MNGRSDIVNHIECLNKISLDSPLGKYILKRHSFKVCKKINLKTSCSSGKTPDNGTIFAAPQHRLRRNRTPPTFLLLIVPVHKPKKNVHP